MNYKKGPLVLNWKYLLAASAVIAIIFAAAQGNHAAREPVKSERETFLLGTLVSIAAYGSDKTSLDLAVSEAIDEIARLEQIFSVNLASSEISRINAAPDIEGGHAISPETSELLALSLKITEETDGAFDPTIGALVRLWGIGTDRAHIPGDHKIAELLPKVGWRAVTLWQIPDEENLAQTVYKISAGKGQELDLGAIAKGYAADRAAQVLRAHGVKSALLNLGGDLVTIGESPKQRGWRLGFQNPYGSRGDYFAVITTADSTLVTSGAYERFFEHEGVRYHHIIDPATGRPAVTDLVSVSIVMGQRGAQLNGARADALSTAIFVMGAEKARVFLDKHKDVQAILVSEDKETGKISVYITEGLADSVILNKNAFSETNPGEKYAY